MYINNIAKKKDLFHKPFFFFSRGEVLCTYPVLLALYMCVFILNSFPCGYFRTGFPFVEYCSRSFRSFYSLITRNYATDFNMNFLEVSLLL